MATQQDIQNMVGYYSNLKNQEEDYITNGKKPNAKLQQNISYFENAVKSQFSGREIAWLSDQVSGARASMRESQNTREEARVKAINDHVTDKSFAELTQNMNGGKGMTPEQIAEVKVTGAYTKHTGKETFDRQLLEDTMPHIINPDGKQFAKNFDEYSEKMDALTQRYREDPVKGKKALEDVGMKEVDVTVWEENGLKFELYNRWSEEDKDMDEFETVEATEDEDRRSDLICAMNESEQVWESSSDKYDDNLQEENSLHGDVARAMFVNEFEQNLNGE